MSDESDERKLNDEPRHSGVRRIGPFEVQGVLGSGGMGTVYLAVQTEPVRRKVAVKVLKSGRGSDVGIARMEAERQALALMNHPSIATVFDAGTTEDGLPYFAMEVVDGLPIIEFCDQRRLGLEERLDLFLQVCEAVQHAHQKMVIHRDLKPSNVLVAIEDGRAVPKLIDFGIAKCLDGPLVDNDSIVTREGLPVGTPQYMSPEQVDSGLMDLDARVDVYALGILLYELLTGVQPLESDNSDSLQLMMRVLKVDYPRPSHRFRRLTGDRQQEIAGRRGMAPGQLLRRLNSDVEWIIMKAIEKDRGRRFGSAAELKADVLRFLGSKPVVARAPSPAYRVGRFLRRYRKTVAAAVIVVCALAAGLIVSTVSSVRARRARDAAQAAEAQANATVAYLRKVLASVDPGVDGRQIKAVDLLTKASNMIADDLADQPEVEAAVRKTIGFALLELGLFEDAGAELEKTVAIQRAVFGDDNPETLNSRHTLGRLLYKIGHYEEAAAIHRAVFELQKGLIGVDDTATQWTMYNLAKDLYKSGDWQGAESYFRENLATRRRVLGPEHPDTLVTVNGLGIFLGDAGKWDEAIVLLRKNRSDLTRVLGERHPDTLRCVANLAAVLNLAGLHTEAEQLCVETLPLMTAALGAEHPETLGLLTQQAVALYHRGSSGDAVVLLRRVLLLRQDKLGPVHPDTLETAVVLGQTLIDDGQIEEGRAYLERALESAHRNLPGNSWHTALFEAEVGLCFARLGLEDEAEPLLASSYEKLRTRNHREAEAVKRALEEMGRH